MRRPECNIPRWTAAAILALAAGCTHAQLGDIPNESPEQRLAALVPQLDSDSLIQRQRASMEIEAEYALTLPMIERALAQPGLSPEQRERLTAAALARFAVQPRGALGVSFSLVDRNTDGVEIGGPIEGFDAARVLEPGDLIVSMSGAPTRNQQQVRAAIISHDPGDVVTIGLRRRGEPMVVQVALGDFRDLERRNNNVRANPRGGVQLQLLNQPAPPPRIDTQTLLAAWDLRQRRTGPVANDAPVIDPGLALEQWVQLESALDVLLDRTAQTILNSRRNGVSVQVSPTRALPAEPGAQQVYPTAIGGGSGRAAVPGMAGDFVLAMLSQEAVQQTDREIGMAILMNEQLLRNHEQMMRDVNLPEQVRQAIEREVMRIKRELDDLRAKAGRLGHVEQ
jgi:hypothetical protein